MSIRIIVTLALMLGTAPAFAAPEHLEIIGQQCGVQLNQSPTVCSCVQQNAGTQLSDTQQAFMAAQVTANVPEITRTQGLLTADDAIGVMQFMSSVVATCGGA
jgi:hypothetical protein